MDGVAGVAGGVGNQDARALRCGASSAVRSAAGERLSQSAGGGTAATQRRAARVGNVARSRQSCRIAGAATRGAGEAAARALPGWQQREQRRRAVDRVVLAA